MKRFRGRDNERDAELPVTRDIAAAVAAWTGETTPGDPGVESEPPADADRHVEADEPAPPREAAHADGGRHVEADEPALVPEAAVPRAVGREGPEPGVRVSLSTATFEDLRELGLSVTQAMRLLNHRERRGRFESVDDLDAVPGFPGALRAALKSRVKA